MKTFNPVYLNQGSDSMYIPANPTLETKINPAMRDNVMTSNQTPAQWHSAKPRWSFSESSGELESPYYMLGVDGREINRVLDLARERHGTVAIKRIVLWVGPECLEEVYPTLRHHKFERAEYRETKVPHLCYVGPAKRWTL